MSQAETISMQFHPRAFSAFGSELVTNDSVALIELVKNCYDAFAYKVQISFGQDTMEDKYIEIVDDGIGMTREIIKNSWAVIATPYKKKNPTIERDGKIRRVTGNKGLGRFSAARLGRYIEITTKSNNNTCISAKIDWENFINSQNISDCVILLNEVNPNLLKSDTGTIVKISGLYSNWDSHEIDELNNGLSRLISPFKKISDFSISLISSYYAEPVEVKTQEFILNPTYKIIGNVLENGSIKLTYNYAPRGTIISNRKNTIEWDDAKKGFDGKQLTLEESVSLINVNINNKYLGGEFSFEIRAWDLDTDSLADVSETFNIKKREIRNNIRQYKGLSIYRDNVLVLPKSDATKDWLGIDIRRVSQIGKRMSTSQIIGMINISSKNNPGVRDTTDREKLVDTIEYKQFCKTIETVILTFENFRDLDRKKPNLSNKNTLNDLLSPLSAYSLVSKVEEIIDSGQDKDKILEAVRDYSSDNERNLLELQDRLIYYAQTASLGSIAVVILHEILTGMTVIKRFLNHIKKQLGSIDDKTKEYFDDSERWHSRLIDVAKSFAPLYKKDLRKEKYKCNINTEALNSIRLISSKKNASNIKIECLIDTSLETPMHPGELQTIFVNLLDNACYWTQNTKREKLIKIESKRLSDKNIQINISDTGIGINKNDAEKIFQPGVTSKPHGIGMGLVIVTELLNNYNCKIATIIPGELSGATFIFDLPIVE